MMVATVGGNTRFRQCYASCGQRRNLKSDSERRRGGGIQ